MLRARADARWTGALLAPPQESHCQSPSHLSVWLLVLKTDPESVAGAGKTLEQEKPVSFEEAGT